MRVRSEVRRAIWLALGMTTAAVLDGTAQTAHAQDAATTTNTTTSPVPSAIRVASANAAAEPAPEADTAGTDALSEVVVTGTRRTGMEAADSPAPIQVLNSSILKRVGQPDLVQSLAQNIPSFTAQAFGGDTAALTLSARLRGLSPNHALVLINGKRRHTTANLAVLGGPYQGGAATDLNFIPVDAIERIEVLQDGAAAQYGSDAIAGVLNIILKDDVSSGRVTASGGAFMDGGGETWDISGNTGFDLGAPGSYLNVTGEARSHERTFRGGIDPRVVDPVRLATYPNSNMALLDGYPYLNRIQGDAHYTLKIASFNAGFDLGGSGTEFYSFGSYGLKKADAYENYRLPSRISTSAGVLMYPFGFSPREASDEKDFALSAGVKGTAMEDWRWDLSSSYGKDDVAINTLDSGNASLFADTGFSPTDFHAGDFIADQWTTTLDVSRDLDVGFMVTPLNVAFGLEHRREGYEIKAGDAASRYKEGSQSFPGFALTDAGSHSRSNNAVYVDFAGSPVSNLQLDLAGRYEDFSDFGSKGVGKFTGRYDFTPAVALRGTLSTGFRAPTLAEEYYSATNVGPSTAFVQLPPNSAAARLIGVDPLKPEKSTNYSAGFVFRPIPRFMATLDAYQIKIKDRIVGSGSLYGAGGDFNSPAVIAAIAANGNVLDSTVSQIGINIFSNGLDTRTRGADLVTTFTDDYSFGHIELNVSLNYNETEVTKIAATPTELAPQSLFDRTAISDLETASPKWRTLMGVTWSRDQFSVNLRETVYGKSSELESPAGATYYETEIGVTPITDLELAFTQNAVRFSLGANNVFNRYPNGRNADLLAYYRQPDQTNNSAVTIYPSFSPFGINGGYYYGKLTYSF